MAHTFIDEESKALGESRKSGRDDCCGQDLPITAKVGSYSIRLAQIIVASV